VSRRRPVRVACLTGAGLALPWLGWSYLSIVVVGNIPFDLSTGPAFWVIMTIWLGSGAALWHPRTEELLARFVYRLRSLSELETRRIGPAWWAVCTAAGADPNRYMV
jgi:hypothetical protein